MDHSEELKHFSLSPTSTYVNAVSLKNHMTLRNACINYRDANGRCWVDSDIPEASAAVSKDQIPCLNRFRNTVGHMSKFEIICFPLQKTLNLASMQDALCEELMSVLETGRLWTPSQTVKYVFSAGSEIRWKSNKSHLIHEHNDILDKLLKSSDTPLSANTVHAAIESTQFGSKVGYTDMFLYPHNASTSVGLIGSLHDNECIDMSPGEKDNKVPNMENRRYDMNDHLGFVCAGHTSHSGEAGRVRRVTCDIRVRILSINTICDITECFDFVREKINKYSDSETILKHEWTLFCMGVYCDVSDADIRYICSFHRRMSLLGPTSFSLHIQSDTKLVIMSVSSGTLLKRCSNGYWADSVEVYRSSRLKWSIKPHISTHGKDAMRACFSAFFCLWPYMEYNKAPRPLIASVQQPQAVCLPWCPATAAVSPCYTFRPVITTSFYNDILHDVDDGDANISSYIPGENVICLFLNLMYTYEDAIIISKRYIDNGGFSTYSLCNYNLSRNEYIPPIGSMMCGILSPWWKSKCQKDCKHSETYLASSSIVLGSKPTGIVHSTTSLRTGDVCVRIRSFQQLQDGDKLSMPHGQKGIVVIVDYENMPIAHNSKHGTIIPDMVMGMSSVITRQTNGVLYEAAMSLSLMEKGSPLPHVVQHGQLPSLEDEFTVVRGTTGEAFKTVIIADNGCYIVKDTRATLGMVRVLNQTQMSRERHQVSHVKIGKNTLRTPDGRARGGGVAWGEMEMQAASSIGLQYCGSEISERGDRVVGKWCTKCQRLGLLHTCTTDDDCVSVKAPYDLIITDCVNAIVHNGSFQYELVPEV